MAYKAKILADSISPMGVRLTTMEITYPRFVHSEFMTHRMFSRNAASSRAIPIYKMIEAVTTDPVMPVWWGKNQAGMQALEELEGSALELAKWEWLQARDTAVAHAEILSKPGGLHKQVVNRLLEPWMWITVIVSATEWENFFHLRCHPDAQPELRKIADMMQEIYRAWKPMPIDYNKWHLPLISEADHEWAVDQYDQPFSRSESEAAHAFWKKVSVGRCARVSYLTHDGKRDPMADAALHDRLLESGHWSPFEHVATPLPEEYSKVLGEWSGNFKGWMQYRKMFNNENYQ